ncbi:MAG: AAA family ATPase [Deltaproteobacteria bacterium]|nr:AAA family ATPase [Deltaproteobacteria bacterium]
MYEAFYGLREKPFNLTPDPDFFFMSQVHENAYTHLEYAIAENKGFVVISGEIGAGKTTLINFLLRNIPEDIETGIINHTNVLPAEFLGMICQEFEVSVNGRSKLKMQEAFHQYLLQMFSQGKRVVLIIDEAQNLPPKTLEEIRMLSNLEAEKHHLIQIILSGQPELKAKLKQKKLAQLAQRVTVYCHLSGMSRREVEQYIHHRLTVAGTKNTGIFKEDALDAVHQNSKGIPRLINRICDTALVYGFAEERKNIDAEIIEEVMKAGEMDDTPADIAGLTETPSRPGEHDGGTRNIHERTDPGIAGIKDPNRALGPGCPRAFDAAAKIYRRNDREIKREKNGPFKDISIVIDFQEKTVDLQNSRITTLH